MAKKRIKGLMHLLETISSLRGKTYLMLSELIDNSISSWIDDGKNISIDGLVVDIDIDLSSEVPEKQKIMVTDNAYGMNEIELENALTLGFKTENKSSGLSIFGMGLKQSAFWMGHKLAIVTKKEQEQGYIATIDLIKLKINQNEYLEEYDLDPAPAPMFRGTIIEISNIRNGVEKNLNFYENILPKILGWKYNKFIGEGLIIKVRFRKDKHDKSITIKKFFPVVENISKWAIDENKDITKTKTEIIDELKKNLSDKKYEKFLKDIIDKIEKDDDLMFPIAFNFKGVQSAIFYGVLSTVHRGGRKEFTDLGYAKVNGISIYQAKRAILCGPNDEHRHTYFKAKDNSGAGLIFQIRLFGYFNIDAYVDSYVQLDTNKQSFKWDDTEFKKHLDSVLENFKSSGISIAVETIGRYQNEATPKGPKNTKRNISKIEEVLINKISGISNPIVSIPEDDLVEISNGTLVSPIVIDNIKVGPYIEKIKLIEDQFDDQSFINQSLNDETLIIRINTKHKLWDPYMINGKDDIKRNIVYPLSIVVGIAQYAINSEDYEAIDGFDLWLTAIDQLKYPL